MDKEQFPRVAVKALKRVAAEGFSCPATRPHYDERYEVMFFGVLHELLDYSHLYARAIGRPVRAGQLFLDSDYRLMGFGPQQELAVERVLEALGSDMQLKGGSLQHHVDGLILNHPRLGSRIIAFDEEQHFTPARLLSLQALQDDAFSKMVELYRTICCDNDYFRQKVLPVHGLKIPRGARVPAYDEFMQLVAQNPGGQNKYSGPRRGFPFAGGRIAQRAYFDLLRDLLHLSAHNQQLNLRPLIRVPRYSIEACHDKPMQQQSRKELREAVRSLISGLAD